MNHNVYDNPLTQRYASKEMSLIWSPMQKFSTWRKLWLCLAKAQKKLGLAITKKQIDELEKNLTNIDWELVKEKEKELRHDVMSHIYAYGVVCPSAKPIIHLGATSCYVTDNTDLILIKESLLLIRKKILKLLYSLKEKATTYKNIPTLGYTHYQPAQLTTVGKRISLWLYDFLLDFHQLQQTIDALPFRGVKGTTGTQASFLTLFHGDHQKVKELDNRISEMIGFRKTVPVCGQTYTRKLDYQVLSVLSGIAQSAYKMAGDVRLWMNLKEVDEPFETNQVGSSAMAYKRNPMRSERICSLARYLISLASNGAHTHATQWFERTLDDSANRRIVLPQAFLTTDAITILVNNIIQGLTVWPSVIDKRIRGELPFMCTETILMECVASGKDRQVLHEAIRQHSMKAARRVKEEGAENDLLERIAGDAHFSAIHSRLEHLTNPMHFIGRAAEQVEEFITQKINPVLQEYADFSQVQDDELNV